jgi:enoyl-CoA hydratase/carnithine racemase
VKGLINRGMQVDLYSGLEMETLAVKDHFRSADFREGVSALAEKRKPVFRR